MVGTGGASRHHQAASTLLTAISRLGKQESYVSGIRVLVPVDRAQNRIMAMAKPVCTPNTIGTQA